MRTKELRQRLNNIKAKKEHLAKEKKRLEFELEELAREEEEVTKLIKIIQEVADAVLKDVTGTVGQLTTLALQTVFGPRLSFEAQILHQRGRPVVDLVLYEDGHPLHPLESAGGGVADLISFALRATFWGLSRDSRPVIFLDEPFKFVSSDLQPYCSKLLRELHEKLGLQFIIISHLPALIEEADAVFEVQRKGNQSYVKKKGGSKNGRNNVDG